MINFNPNFSLSPYQGLVYNCDGCLYPNAGELLAQFRTKRKSLLHKLNIPESSFEELAAYAKSKGKGFVNFLMVVSEEVNLPMDSVELAWSELIDYSFIKPNPELNMLFEQWVKAGKNLAVLTNNSKVHVQKVFDKLQFSGLVQDAFDVITPEYNYGEGCYIAKPHPESFTGIFPESDLFFDDTEQNIKAAEALGIKSVLLTKETTVQQQTLKAVFA